MRWPRSKLSFTNSRAEMCVVSYSLGFSMEAEWVILKRPRLFLSQNKTSSAMSEHSSPLSSIQLRRSKTQSDKKGRGWLEEKFRKKEMLTAPPSPQLPNKIPIWKRAQSWRNFTWKKVRSFDYCSGMNTGTLKMRLFLRLKVNKRCFSLSYRTSQGFHPRCRKVSTQQV